MKFYSPNKNRSPVFSFSRKKGRKEKKKGGEGKKQDTSTGSPSITTNDLHTMIKQNGNAHRSRSEIYEARQRWAWNERASQNPDTQVIAAHIASLTLTETKSAFVSFHWRIRIKFAYQAHTHIYIYISLCRGKLLESWGRRLSRRWNPLSVRNRTVSLPPSTKKWYRRRVRILRQIRGV